MDLSKFDFIVEAAGLSVLKLIVPESKLFSKKRKLVAKRAKAYSRDAGTNRRGVRGK